MNVSFSRVLAVTVAGALLVLEAATPAHAAEPGSPTGTFTLNRTLAYLHVIDGEQDRPYGERFRITASNLSDDKTAPEDLVLEKSRGDGSGFVPAAFPCSPDGFECSLTYTEPGTFTPQVRLTDEDGNSTTIDLPIVTVRRDLTPPVVHVIKPARKKLHRVSAWRRVRGTVFDQGVGGNFREGEPDGILSVKVALLQQRRARWWCYSFVMTNPRTGQGHWAWLKGLQTEAATFAKCRPFGIEAPVVTGIQWRTPWIKGLTRGPLVVRVNAVDFNLWETGYRKYAWVRLNRG